MAYSPIVGANELIRAATIGVNSREISVGGTIAAQASGTN